MAAKTLTFKQKIAEFLLIELVTNPQVAGVPDHVHGALSALPLGELRSYAKKVSEKFLSVEIDLPALEAHFADGRRRNQLLEELIKRGASIRFIGLCLDFSPHEIREVEHRLNITRNRCSKKIKWDEYDYFRRIYDSEWEKVSKDAYPQALALIETAKKTRYPISRIESVVLIEGLTATK